MPSFAGCAITKPNKVNVIKYLDALDPLCAKMGACNTVVKDGEKLNVLLKNGEKVKAVVEMEEKWKN